MIAVWLAAAVGPPATVAVAVPGDGPAVVLRVAVFDPGDRWRAFLGRLFTHFDRDADGTLTAGEAARVFPLPLPDGRTVPPPAGPTDAAGFREQYRRAGFAPVVARAEPPAAKQRTLAAALFVHLDRDADGVLAAAELAAAPDLVRRLDADDDEVLTAAELLPPGFAPKPSPAPEPVRVAVTAGGGPVAPPPGRFPGGTFRTVADDADPAAGAREAGRFLLAQLRTAGDRLTRPRLAADPALATLTDLFDPADRDADGVLTAAELDAFLQLLADGVGCQTLVVVADAGRSAFDACDDDADGRLDRHELATLTARLPAGVTAGTLPRAVVLRVGRGPVAGAFGPLRLPTARPRPRPSAESPDAPVWFAALDRNRDGFLSPAEWVGPPAAFRRLDADADGRVSAAEAGRPR